MQIYRNKRNRLHKKEFNSHRTGLGHKHGRRFIVLGTKKYGRHDVMWKHTIVVIQKFSYPGYVKLRFFSLLAQFFLFMNFRFIYSQLP